MVMDCLNGEQGRILGPQPPDTSTLDRRAALGVEDVQMTAGEEEDSDENMDNGEEEAAKGKKEEDEPAEGDRRFAQLCNSK